MRAVAFFLVVVVVVAQGLVVQTSLGPIVGVDAGSQWHFFGIPYAQPPVGSLRFAAPRPHTPWVVPFNASSYGPMCPQPVDAQGYTFPSDATFNEDCLTLNIFVPKQQPNKGENVSSSSQQEGFPVFVWFHGGGLTQGGSYENRLWGAPMSSRNVIVVTANYRLGALGFLSSAQTADSNVEANGLFGFADQQLVLRFVRQNIAAFSGNPDAVTIAGESSGGSSVAFHMLAPASNGLFRGAILESGVPLANALPLSQSSSMWSLVASKLSCGNGGKKKGVSPSSSSLFQCLRQANVTWQSILAAQLSSPVTTVATCEPSTSSLSSLSSSSSLPCPAGAILKKNDTLNVAHLMGGNTHDEGTLFVPRNGLNLTTPQQYLTQLSAFATQMHFPIAPSVFATTSARVYPCTSSCTAQFTRLVADVVLVCPTNLFLHAFAAAQKNRVFAYDFNVNPTWVKNPSLGAFHSSEIEFVFGNLIRARHVATPQELALSNQMTDAWANFTTQQQPSPEWPLFSPQNSWPRVQLMTSGLSIQHNWRESQCDFWNKFLYQLMP